MISTHEGFQYLIAIGDIHGELEGFLEMLEAARIIDSNMNWCAEGIILLQIGDVIDRGPYSLESYHCLERLQIQARRFSSRVIRLVGNHELELLRGFFSFANYPSPERLAAKIKEDVMADLLQAAYYYQGYLFTHAGFRMAIVESVLNPLPQDSAEWGGNGMTLKLAESTNRLFKESVIENNFSHPIFNVSSTRGGEDPLGGIFWEDWFDISNCEEDFYFPQVIGHTPPVHEEINTVRYSHKGRLINIDAGMCIWYGGNRSFLVFEGNRPIPLILEEGGLKRIEI